MIKIKQLITAIKVRFLHLNLHKFSLIAGISVAIITTIYTFTFFKPKTITYDYSAAQSCIFNPTFLPNLNKVKNNQSYAIKNEPTIKLSDKILFSSKSCFSLSNPNKGENPIKIHPLKNPLLSQSIKIKQSTPPTLSIKQNLDIPTSTIGDLSFELNMPDGTFEYKIEANKKTAQCQKLSNALKCPIKDLGLVQSQTYPVVVDRYLNEQKIETVFNQKLKTVDPIIIKASSIPEGSLVLDKSKQIILTTNKTLVASENVSLTDMKTGLPIKINALLDKNMLVINMQEEMPRESVFQLKVAKLTASDQAFLSADYSLNFATSGGPKVSRTNIVSYGESTTKNFVLSFDSNIDQAQNIKSLINISNGSGTIPANIYIGQNSVTIEPTEILSKCTSYTIEVKTGIKNIYGVESSSGWQTSFRTICQEVINIGSSVQGRNITAYKFGNGPSKYIFIGATHGDEKGSKYLLDSWVNELEANYPSIGADKTIYVVPLLNPDGFASGTRTNANNVDLNRNFPANNWKSTVKMPTGETLTSGGGTGPLSEPESSSIAGFITNHSPKLVLTYHSKGSMVIANESGNSFALAQEYGEISGYFSTKESSLGTTFAYDTTGAMENWLYDKKNIPTLLIELKTHTQNEFYRNKSAMWAMIN